MLINLSFIILLISTKEYKFLSNKTIKLILILYLYLIFNSIVSENFSIGALRNFGFMRFIILFCAFNYFFYHKSFFNKILIIWSLTLFILTIDTYFESFNGKNILGYGELYGNRIVSFFENEPIVGGYINAFYLIIVGYFFFLSNKLSSNYKYLILAVSLFFLSAIVLTGERSNTIKAIFGFLVFYSTNSHFNIKQKLISILLIVILFISLVNSSSFLKLRYNGQLLELITGTFKSKIYKTYYKETYPNRKANIFKILYVDIYISGFNVFKSYPFFGVGNKNYRLVTCANAEIKNPKFICNTHPHQTYFEFLSEHGLIGTAILILILFNLVFAKLPIILQSKNFIQLGSFTFLLTIFLPFLPSGAFFSDYNLTIFWLNLSLMYAVNKKTNVFSRN